LGVPRGRICGFPTIVKNADAANVPGLSLDHPQPSHEISGVTGITSESNASKVLVPVTDQIALSLATKFLQQAANAGGEVRLERILQLKTAIVKEQYVSDPLVVGRALIEAHLRGE
jgi:anti-sigma28 factor (negative regulator of flagellin synthesis)